MEHYILCVIYCRAFDIPAVDDNTSSTNSIKMLLRFVLNEVVVQFSKSADKIDTPYLMLLVDKLFVDAAVTVYGMAAQASLGSIQLVDKIHTGPSGEYLEILRNKSTKQLISVIYREVRYLRIHNKLDILRAMMCSY